MTFTIESLKASVEKRYNAFTVVNGEDELVFRNPALMSKADRAAYNAILGELASQRDADDVEDDDVDLEDVTVKAVRDALELVCEQGDFTALVKAIGEDNLAYWLELWRVFQEATKPGEASPSRS